MFSRFRSSLAASSHAQNLSDVNSASGEDAQLESDLNLRNSHELRQAVAATLKASSDQVLDGTIGCVGDTAGIISFDNYATCGIIDNSVKVESMTVVCPWDDSWIGGFGGDGAVPPGPLPSK